MRISPSAFAGHPLIGTVSHARIQAVQIPFRFLSRAEYNDLFALLIFFCQLIHLGQLFLGKIQDPLPEFFIKFLLHPRQILPLFPDPRLRSLKADFKRIIQENTVSQACIRISIVRR